MIMYKGTQNTDQIFTTVLAQYTSYAVVGVMYGIDRFLIPKPKPRRV